MIQAPSNTVSRKSPAFLARSVIYQLFPRAFTRRGTLNAAAELLPFLKNLGVDIIQLTPITEHEVNADPATWSKRQTLAQTNCPSSPYRLRDYEHVDPEYGTDEELTAFVRAAHSLGLRVTLDVVFFHCGPNATFLKAHPDYVCHAADGSIELGQWNMPKLNYANPALRAFVTQTMVTLLQRYELDGFRADVSDAIPLDFWEEARDALEAVRPGLILLSEGSDPNYLLKAFDMMYDFYWQGVLHKVFCGEKGATALVDIWKEVDNASPKGYLHIRNYDNHDIASDSYDQRLETLFGTERTEAALALNFTINGVPFLYNGCEIGDRNRHSIFANRSFGPGLTIEWERALTPAGQARIAWIQRLCALRHGLAVLQCGALRWLPHERPESVLAFERTLDQERVVVLINVTLDEVLLTLPQLPPETLLARRATRVQAVCQLGPGGVLMLRG